MINLQNRLYFSNNNRNNSYKPNIKSYKRPKIPSNNIKSVDNKLKIKKKKPQPFSKMIGRPEDNKNQDKCPDIGYYNSKLNQIYPKIRNVFFKEIPKKIAIKNNKMPSISILPEKLSFINPKPSIVNSIQFQKMLGRSKGIQWYKNYTETEKMDFNNLNPYIFKSYDNCKVPNFNKYPDFSKKSKKKIYNIPNYDPKYDFIKKRKLNSINFKKCWSRKFSYLNLKDKKVINNKYYFKNS